MVSTCSTVMWKAILFALIFCAISLSAVNAINCYVCDASDTNSPFQCGEWFERFDEPDIQPQNCSNVHDAKYCIKHIGRYEGGIGAKRFCSSKDLGNYCDYVKNKGDRMDYRSCIFTCDTDGCNAAHNVRAVYPFQLICGATIALTWLLMKFWSI